MRPLGFSTGALAAGDFAAALAMLRAHAASAVELSALREHELGPLMRAAAGLELSGYTHVSVHAPTRLVTLSEGEAADLLAPCIDRAWHVIVHPDIVRDAACWRPFGRLLCLENLDGRRSTGRTAGELAPAFDALPEASLCFDFGHARQVDSTLATGRAILRAYGDRLAELQLSEVDARGRHASMSLATVLALRQVAHLTGACPVILESTVLPARIDDELRLAASCFRREEAAAPPSVPAPVDPASPPAPVAPVPH